MQLSSRILTALAVLILAVAVVAVRAGSTGTVDAATGTINVVNVGTCYTTDTDIFNVGDCDDGDGNAEDTDAEGYSVAGRDSITAADNVFATYAIDPKTSGDQPRAILKNADVIKISVEDKGRDKRTGQLYAVSNTDALTGATIPTGNGDDGVFDDDDTRIILGALGDDLAAELYTLVDPDTAVEGDEVNRITLSSNTAFFDRLQEAGGAQQRITTSGDAQFALTGEGSTESPMAPKDDGKVYWFGDVTTDGTAVFSNLAQYIELDEDLSTGEADNIAPWMRVTASLPADVVIDVQYIYYQTSEQEELVGGKKTGDYNGMDGNPEGDVSPVFTDDESGSDPDALDPARQFRRKSPLARTSG